MKRVLFIIAFILMTVMSSAQSKVYIIVKYGIGTASVDFGQETTLFSNNDIVDDNGKVVHFNSPADVLNYLSSKGWNYEDTIMDVSGSNGNSSSHTSFIMSKIVAEGEDIGINTKNTFSKNTEVNKQDAMSNEEDGAECQMPSN